MTQKVVYEVKRDSSTGRVTSIKDFTYEVSNRLKANPCSLIRSRETSFSTSGSTLDPGGNNTGMSTASSSPLDSYALNLPSGTGEGVYNKTYGKFVSKLKNSDAALGVTLGSYNETRGMVIERVLKLDKMATRLLKDKRVHQLSKADFLRASFTKGSTEKVAKYIASNHLEWIFGWVPLYKDLNAVTAVLADMTIPPMWLTATGRSSFFTERVGANQNGTTWYSSNGTATCTMGALVNVTNPNIYLANRLGLANLPGIAWDLVPWSFVVNMFGNFNQVISSFTDLAGISYSQTSTTYTYKGVGTQRYKASSSHVAPKLTGTATAFHYKKVRVLNAPITRPSLILKLPDVSGGLIGMASALLVQKFGSLGKLLR